MVNLIDALIAVRTAGKIVGLAGSVDDGGTWTGDRADG